MPKDANPRFLPGSDAEWTGLFLFGVGVYGCLKLPIMRHYQLFGWLPADWFYLGLLGVGGGLMLGAAPFAAAKDEGPLPWQARAGYAFRVVAAVGLVAFMVYRVVRP
jgi:hypothetical protein